MDGVGGGLTGRRSIVFGTGQYEKEWKTYHDILLRSNVTKYTKWLDIKGNHGKKNKLIFEIKSLFVNK